MNYTINGKPFTHASRFLADVIEAWGAAKPFVVAVNKEFVPLHKHRATQLKAGDEVDVLSPIQGG
jgi:sulfur carrier protein